MAILGITFLRPIAALLGAEGTMLDDCVRYGRIILLALPLQMLQIEFQSFFIAAEKPQLGLIVTIASGVANMLLDALLVAVFLLGLEGAAIATAVSQAIGGIIPLLYFSRPNTALLRLGRTNWEARTILRAATNGSSEMMSNISMSIVSMLYNVQLMAYAGESGVAAYGVLMYVNMIFLAIFIGYSVGTAPVISFHYGAEHHDELRGLLRQSSIIIAIVSVVMFAAAEGLGSPLSRLFAGYDDALCAMTERGFMIYSFSFLFAGMSIFGSSFFTALGDGLTSALISFLRTLLFQIVAVLTLPLIWEIDGVWISIVVAEVFALIVTELFLVLKRKKYGY